MTTTVEPYASVMSRAAELNCPLPAGLVMLPANFESVQEGEDFRYRGEASTLTKVLSRAGIAIEKLGGNNQPKAFIHNKSHDWALPIIFIGTELLKQQPDMLSLALSAIQEYATELFKGVTADRTVKLQIVVGNSKTDQYRKITYEGDPSAITQIEKIVRTALKK